MKHRCLVVFVFALLVAGCATEPMTLATSQMDLDHHGRMATVSLQLISGRRYNDTDLWCGMGKKVEGKFAVVVSVDGKQTTTSLNPFYPDRDTLWFGDGSFDLVFQDYTQDGRAEFNLGQYGSCGGWDYRLFAIDPNGAVSLLPGPEINSADTANSTRELAVDHGLITTHYYYVDHAGPRTAVYQWDKAKGAFNLVKDVSDDGAAN